MAKEFNLEIDDNLNEVVDELPGNRFIAFRRLRWNENSSFKYDLRNWYTNAEGDEIAGKGVSFMTPEGPSNLAEALLKHGFGDTRRVLDEISNRDDFLTSVKEIITERNIDLNSIQLPDIESIGDYYDPKSILE